MAELKLTLQERKYLDRVNVKFSKIKDALRGVVDGYFTGLFVHGEGGTGKSYCIEKELKRLQAPVVHHNSRLTGKGMINELKKAPDHIHLVQDAETLLDDRRAVGVLRAALWSQSNDRPKERLVTWTAHETDIEVWFIGGIILVSN